jgi:precorrin-8X/cobalt-precorrin-8 methylmutase
VTDLVIAADWSAEQGRKPTPQENRCWLAWGTPGRRSDPEYMPTRFEAMLRIASLLNEHAGARALVVFDFAIGYPCGEDGSPVLPVGRELCALMHATVADNASGINNRFEAGAALNERIMAHTGAPVGPFWGRPRTLRLASLPELRPSGTLVAKLRACELSARRLTGSKPKSPWQLAGIGSVGGQSLVGLAAVHTLLASLGGRGHLWPFEPVPERADAVTIAEVYPSLFPRRSPLHWYKDARQVVDTRDALLDWGDPASLLTSPPSAQTEGWILGVPAQPTISPSRISGV